MRTSNLPTISNTPSKFTKQQLTVLAPVLSNPDIIRRELASRSFYHFVKEFWDCVNDDDFIDNWHIKYICDECQIVVERAIQMKPKLYDLIINVPPGTSKSTIVSRMLPAWAWQRRLKKNKENMSGFTGKKLKFITASFEAGLALELADDTRDIINSDKYRLYFPNIKLRRDRNNKSNYRIEGGGGRVSAGTRGTITGYHAHVIIVDDPINPKDAEAASGAKLKEVNNFMSKTLSTRKVNKAVTPLILLMQRLAEDDPTGNALVKAATGKYRIKHICLPGEIVENAKVEVSPPELRKHYVGKLLDPKRMGRDVLPEMETELGQYGYAGQVLQDPSPPQGGMFKPDRMATEDFIPGHLEVMQWVRYWDKAGTKDGGAYTVGVKMGLLSDGRYVIANVIRGQWDSDKREQVIKDAAIQDGFNCIVYVEQEPGSGGKESAQSTIRNLAGYVVHKDHVTGSKESRADPFSVQVNSSNVFMIKAEWNTPFKEEYRLFPNSKYKDQVDAGSGAFSKLTSGSRAGTW